MTKIPNSTDTATRQIRRVARIWGAVVIALTLFIAAAHIIAPETESTDYPPIENLLPVVMLVSVLGLMLAWRWEGIGGGINVGLFLAHLGLYWIIRGKFFPLGALLILSVAVVPGVLFLVCWWRTRLQDGDHSNEKQREAAPS